MPPLRLNLSALEAFANSDSSKPVSMLNQLKFRRLSPSPDPANNGTMVSGEELFRRYHLAAARLPSFTGRGADVSESGVRLLLEHHACLVRAAGEWDSMLVVYYPSRRSFLEMIQSAEYALIEPLRRAAVENSRLYALDCATATT